jgi:hypothetical protein
MPSRTEDGSFAFSSADIVSILIFPSSLMGVNAARFMVLDKYICFERSLRERRRNSHGQKRTPVPSGLMAQHCTAAFLSFR